MRTVSSSAKSFSSAPRLLLRSISSKISMYFSFSSSVLITRGGVRLKRAAYCGLISRAVTFPVLLIVIGMCQHMLYEYLLGFIVHPSDQPISIPLNVEHSACSDWISSRKRFTHVRNVCPRGLFRDPIPSV